MNDTQLLRYSRHILLDQIGITGQEKIIAAHALIIGAGGLGYLVIVGQSKPELAGKGLAAGIAIVLLGIILDRIAQGRPEKSTQGHH